jgi:hypothetical protein
VFENDVQKTVFAPEREEISGYEVVGISNTYGR